MKVLIMTLGTRGDVQPFIALARGLLAPGTKWCSPRRNGLPGSPLVTGCRSRAWTTARCG